MCYFFAVHQWEDYSIVGLTRGITRHIDINMTTYQIPAASPISLKGDVAGNWIDLEDAWENYCLSTHQAQKCYWLLFMCREAQQVQQCKTKRYTSRWLPLKALPTSGILWVCGTKEKTDTGMSSTKLQPVHQALGQFQDKALNFHVQNGK